MKKFLKILNKKITLELSKIHTMSRTSQGYKKLDSRMRKFKTLCKSVSKLKSHFKYTYSSTGLELKIHI